MTRPVTTWFLSISMLTTPNFILVQTRLLLYLRLLPLNLAPWEFTTGSWTKVFTSTHLSLRPSLSSTQGLKPLQTLAESVGSISVAGSPIKLQTSIKNLGVYLDFRLSFDTPLSETCKASYSHIRALRYIRSSLTTEAAKTVVTAIVGSRLDYCNSHLAGASDSNRARLQLVQNTLARVLAHKSRFDHITPVLSELYWVSRLSQNNFQDSYHHSQGATVSTTLLPCCNHFTLCTCAITPIFFIHVNMCSSAQNLSWQPLDRFRLSHQKFGNALPGHLSFITTLPAV